MYDIKNTTFKDDRYAKRNIKEIIEAFSKKSTKNINLSKFYSKYAVIFDYNEATFLCFMPLTRCNRKQLLYKLQDNVIYIMNGANKATSEYISQCPGRKFMGYDNEKKLFVFSGGVVCDPLGIQDIHDGIDIHRGMTFRKKDGVQISDYLVYGEFAVALDYILQMSWP